MDESNLLPQVGRIIHHLMGNQYRLLYQENYFRSGADMLVTLLQIRPNLSGRTVNVAYKTWSIIWINNGLDHAGVTTKKPVVYVTKHGWSWCRDAQEEAVWHLFFWAVMSNDREIAEHLLFETSCKIGA